MIDRPIDIGSESVKVKLVRVYEGHHYNGYVYRLEAQGSKQFRVDLSALSIGNPNKAIVSHIDRQLIGGEEEKERVAFLHIVAKKGSMSSKYVLPLEIKSPGESRAEN